MKERLLTISYKERLSHIGSNLTALEIIDSIYTVKRPEDIFILSSGHAGLAYYLVLEKHGYGDAEEMYRSAGIHVDKTANKEVKTSTGSLGQGLPIALGMALADRSRRVYCLCSDGEMAEGSMWEALRIGAEYNLTNLRPIINCNGYAAYKEVNLLDIRRQTVAFGWQTEIVDATDRKMIDIYVNGTPQKPFAVVARTNSDTPFSQGLGSHYHTMTEEEYERAIRNK